MEWESRSVVKSKVQTGVEFAIAKMTFGRRIELMRRVRDLACRLEYFQAGRDEKQQMEASLLAAELDRVYLDWGLAEVRGLTVDGSPVDVPEFVENGPEDLVLEALGLIRFECGLAELERKN